MCKRIYNIIKYFLILAGLFMFSNGTVMLFISNINAGNIATFLLGIFFLSWGLFFEKINELTKKGILRIIKYLIIAAICFEAVLVGYVAVYGERDTATYKEDALIVLGAGLRGDRITLPLKLRLDKAVEYHEKNPDALIVVSGGQGPQETVTEAYAMKKYLVSAGIDEDLIIEEDRATSTSENLKFSKKILEDIYGREVKIAFVTNNFHVFRSSRLAKMAGFEDVTYLHTSLQWYNYVPCYLRESMAIFKMWILGY